MPSNNKHSQLNFTSYQLVPLLKIIHNDLSSILIADGVGVGKTISAIYIALYSFFKFKKPIIIITPAHLMTKWAYELRTKFQIRTFTVNNQDLFTYACQQISNYEFNEEPYIILISNSFLHKPLPPLESSCIIFDEIHHYRNFETQSYSNAKEIAKTAKIKVGLSATPINNSYQDLVSELSILLSDYTFEQIDNVIDVEWDDLSKFLYCLTTCYRKEKLGIHFTKRKIFDINVIYNSDYISNVNELISYYYPNKNQTFFGLVTYYRLAASSKNAFFKSIGHIPNTKINDQKINKLNSLIRTENIQKAIVFCSFKETIHELSSNLNINDILTLTGDTREDERDEILQNFQNSKINLLLMTEVGAEGLDLQSCDTIINYDLHWNPMRLEQRIGRIDRIGQKKKSISIYNFHVIGSIDDRVLEIIENKLDLISESVFKTFKIINFNTKKPKPKAHMFNNEVLNDQERQSTSLLQSLQLLKKIPSQDYDILPNIKNSFCKIDNLRLLTNNNKLIWNDEPSSQLWIQQILSSSKKIKDTINYYS